MISAHMVLIGLPGSGKSTIGAAVAQQLGCSFQDLDREIERRTGRSIPEIFEQDGESSFRKLENELTLELARTAPMVLAPGGGWVTNPANVALLRPPALLVYLHVSVDTALARLRTDPHRRPLLSGADPRERLTQLWRDRAALYARADHEIDTEVLAVQEVVSRVAQLAQGLDERVR